MSFRRYLIFLFFILKLPSISLAQNNCVYTLSGKIIDEHDKSALSYATIYILESNYSTISDEKGKYIIKNLCEGEYTIQVAHLGCETITEKIIIKKNTIKNFYPEHHTEELSEMTIIALKKEQNYLQKMEMLPTKIMEENKGKTIGESLASIAGVTNLKTGNNISKPMIHGMYGNRILILNNGIRHEGQQWGNEHAPEIDPFIAGKLSVLKGASSVRYGADAIGGVVLVEPRQLRDSSGIGGELNLIGFSNGRMGVVSGILEGNFKKIAPLSWRVQGTFKQGGNVQAPNYYINNTGVKEHNFSTTLGWIKDNYQIEVFYSQFNTDIGIFSGAHIGNLSDLEKAMNKDLSAENNYFSYTLDRPLQHIEHELFKTKFNINLSNHSNIDVVYARQYNLRYEYDKHKPRGSSSSNENNPELQLEITTHTLDVALNHKLSTSTKGVLGVNMMTQGNTYQGRYFIPNFRNYQAGMYFIERLVKEKYEIETGVRYDYRQMNVFKYEKVNSEWVIVTPELTYHNVSGTIGGILKMSKSTNISYHFGTAWRPPNVNELYTFGVHHGAASFEKGDENLQVEKAYNNMLSFNFQKNEKISIELTAYSNYIQNYIYLKPSDKPVLTIRGAFPAFEFTQTNAWLNGIDASFIYHLNKAVQYQGKASILRAWNSSAAEWLIMMPSDRYTNEITYRFDSAKKIHDGYITIQGEYVTEQKRVPVNADFMEPPKAYFLTHAEIGCKIAIYKQDVNIGIGVRNIFNVTYRDYLDRLRYYTDAMGRNISVRITLPINYIY
jgi:iron complex outermembrane recepter protein